MNAFDKTLLFTMSYALMRRFAFIEVPPPSDDDLSKLIDLTVGGNERASQMVKTLTCLNLVKRFGAAPFMDAALYALERFETSDDTKEIAYECFYSFSV